MHANEHGDGHFSNGLLGGTDIVHRFFCLAGLFSHTPADCHVPRGVEPDPGSLERIIVDVLLVQMALAPI